MKFCNSSQPCLNLISAVLRDAIIALAARGRQRNEAAAWVGGLGDGPFSFLWCCAALGLHPERVLAELMAKGLIVDQGGVTVAAPRMPGNASKR